MFQPKTEINTVLCTGQFGAGKTVRNGMCVTPLEGFYCAIWLVHNVTGV